MGKIELLVRTHFTLVAAKPGTLLRDVIGYGSGFMMSYMGYRFFVTAAHVTEPTWSTQVKEIGIRNNDVAIVTHLAQEYDGVKQTIYVPFEKPLGVLIRDSKLYSLNTAWLRTMSGEHLGNN